MAQRKLQICLSEPDAALLQHLAQAGHHDLSHIGRQAIHEWLLANYDRTLAHYEKGNSLIPRDSELTVSGQGA